MAVATEGARTLAFVADQDAQRVTVVDVELGQELASAELGAAPGALLVSPSGMVAVTLPLRSQVQLLAFDGKALASRCAIATPAEPVALALTPDARSLLVASAWGHALTAYSTATLAEQYQVDLPREPRAVVVDDEGAHAFIAHAVGSVLSRVELATQHVERASLDAPPSFEALDRIRGFKDDMAALMGKASAERKAEMQAQVDEQIKLLRMPERTANYGFSLVLAHRAGASSVLVPQVEVESGRRDVVSAGYGAGSQASVAPSVAVLDAKSLHLDDHSIPSTPSWREPAEDVSANCRLPRAAVLDETSGTLLVVCLGSDALVGYDFAAPSPVDASTLRVQVASGPTGVALDQRGRRALVWSQFERVLSEVALPSALSPLSAKDVAARRIALRPLPKPGISSEIALGRRLFHAVDDPRIARDGRACASCHIEGRDDGLVWSTPGGPRRTKLLAGVAPTSAPYAWDGSAATLHDQIEGTLDRLDGEGGLRPYEMDALVAYVSSLAAPPSDDRVQAERVATIARGQALFSSTETGCASCHAGKVASDGARHAVHSETIADVTQRFDTPSLAHLSGRAPYFHDGSFASLRELLTAQGDRMGHTSQLSPTDLAALEAYLETL